MPALNENVVVLTGITQQDMTDISQFPSEAEEGTERERDGGRTRRPIFGRRGRLRETRATNNGDPDNAHSSRTHPARPPARQATDEERGERRGERRTAMFFVFPDTATLQIGRQWESNRRRPRLLVWEGAHGYEGKGLYSTCTAVIG